MSDVETHDWLGEISHLATLRPDARAIECQRKVLASSMAWKNVWDEWFCGNLLCRSFRTMIVAHGELHLAANPQVACLVLCWLLSSHYFVKSVGVFLHVYLQRNQNHCFSVHPFSLMGWILLKQNNFKKQPYACCHTGNSKEVIQSFSFIILSFWGFCCLLHTKICFT